MLTTATSPPVRSSQQRFLALVRGETQGLWPAFQRFALWFASLPYGIAIRLRNLFYTWGWLKSERVSVPVISVGNLTVGGTGKTPCVEQVAGFYRTRDLCIAILSRGYGAVAGRNDEALVLEENLPDVPHLQGADRVGLARTAVEELESEILLLDDGFQHRRLARDLDIVLIDATEPWGLGHLLPRGLLREPVTSLSRAAAIVLTRCDQVNPAELDQLRRRIGQLAPNALVAEAVHRPVELRSCKGATWTLEMIRSRKVAGFCGLGNPRAFEKTIRDLGVHLIDFRCYPDHHPYSAQDVEDLRGWARRLPEDTILLTSQKDLVKLRVDQLGGRSLWAVRICLTFQSGQHEFEQLLAGVIPNEPDSHRGE